MSVAVLQKNFPDSLLSEFAEKLRDGDGGLAATEFLEALEHFYPCAMG
jgi:hypothetical protein